MKNYITAFGEIVAIVEKMCETKISPKFIDKSFNEHLFLREWTAKAMSMQDHPLYPKLVDLCQVAEAEGWRALLPTEVANSWLAYNNFKEHAKITEIFLKMGEKISNVILKSSEVLKDATLYFCDVDYPEESDFSVSYKALPVIVYDDGTTFTLWDWTGAYPENASEIENFEWQLGTTGEKAVMLDHLPRIFV